MAKPTPMQRYYLFQIVSMRWFGAIFAGLAMLITASNLPSLLRSGDMKVLGLNLAGGLAFVLIGFALYRGLTVIERRYRANIKGQVD
jgi:hypothetical protein